MCSHRRLRSTAGPSASSSTRPRSGRTKCTCMCSTTRQRPHDSLEKMTLRMSLPSKAVGPIEEPMEDAGPGHWSLVSSDFTIAGKWEVTAVAAGLQVRRPAGHDHCPHPPVVRVRAGSLGLVPLDARTGSVGCKLAAGSHLLNAARCAARRLPRSGHTCRARRHRAVSTPSTGTRRRRADTARG